MHGAAGGHRGGPRAPGRGAPGDAAGPAHRRRPRFASGVVPGEAPREGPASPAAAPGRGRGPRVPRGHRDPRRRARAGVRRARSASRPRQAERPPASSRSPRAATSARRRSRGCTTSTTRSAPSAPTQLRQALPDRVPRGEGGARHRRPRQDRLPDRAQDAARGRRVVATTRFPHDAALRYSREPDFAEWRDRLHVHGLDLRHSPSVEIFARYVETAFDRLDILVNNACQTVRRPPGFYAHLLANEERPASDFPAEVRGLLRSHEGLKAAPRGGPALPAKSRAGQHRPHGLARRPGRHRHHVLRRPLPGALRLRRRHAPERPLPRRPGGRRPAAGGPARAELAGGSALAEVPTPEMLEVQLVNAVAPFILCARLKPLMLRQPSRDKHVVNVSAMEGIFSRGHQDRQAPPHQHGQGGPQHDDAHGLPRLREGRHPHERRGHGLGHRRGPGRPRRAQEERAGFPAARWTSWTARRGSATRSSRGSSPASTSGASSSRTTSPRAGDRPA